jgi:hypothetical protein
MVIGVDDNQPKETLVLGRKVRTFPSDLLVETEFEINNWEINAGYSPNRVQRDVILKCMSQ